MKSDITRLRTLYKTRYVFRLCVLGFTIFMYLTYPQSFHILTGFNFFKTYHGFIYYGLFGLLIWYFS